MPSDGILRGGRRGGPPRGPPHMRWLKEADALRKRNSCNPIPDDIRKSTTRSESCVPHPRGGRHGWAFRGGIRIELSPRRRPYRRRSRSRFPEARYGRQRLLSFTTLGNLRDPRFWSVDDSGHELWRARPGAPPRNAARRFLQQVGVRPSE